MSATFVICVHDFPRREVWVKVGVMEFGLNHVWFGLMLYTVDALFFRTAKSLTFLDHSMRKLPHILRSKSEVVRTRLKFCMFLASNFFGG